MKARLDPIDGPGETYRVILVAEDDDSEIPGGQDVGTVSRVTGDRWELAVSSSIPAMDRTGQKVSNGATLSMIAKDVVQLATVIGMRFGTAQEKDEKEANDQMERHTAAVLRSLNVMACNTGSMPGFMSGLSSVMAGVLTEDVKDGDAEEFLQTFVRQVSERVAAMKQLENLKSSLDVLMARVLKAGVDDEDKADETIKH